MVFPVLQAASIIAVTCLVSCALVVWLVLMVAAPLAAPPIIVDGTGNTLVLKGLLP